MMRGLLLTGMLTVLLAARLAAEPIVVSAERMTEVASAGRILFNELGCVNCHGGDTGLPERKGPLLAGVTQRVHAQWLREFIADPAKTKPGTAMPHLVKADEVEAVVHYLASLPAKGGKPKSAKYLNAERGSDVYHSSGCVACHAPGADFQPPAGVPKKEDFTHSSVPLPDLKAKYSLGTLSAFLSDPLAVRPDGRMPHFTLDATDVTDLAAFLLDLQQSDGSGLPEVKPLKPDAALVAKGKAVVQAARCAACHDLPADVKAEPVVMNHKTGGCLDGTAGAKYELTPHQRVSLDEYLAHREVKLAAKEQLSLSLQVLNCTQCHVRDELGGPDVARKAYFMGDHNLGDTGLLPPPLTQVGRKLKPGWFRDVLKGKARVRPYLQTQMPLYGKAADGLPALFEKVDAVTVNQPMAAGDSEVGKKLLGTQGGVGCITCHRWEKRPSLGIQALDISQMDQRLRHEWLQEYLVNPAAYRPGTLMPSFWPEGKAANTVLLGGDTMQQIASIYAFAAMGKGEPEGYPANQGGEFELIPKDRPILQRTFMEEVGAQAILVGFPAGLHFAYDAKSARPALVWKGKFFDAYSTWFSREAPFEKPLGEVLDSWPTGDSEPRRYLGYQLDAAGVPSFLYESGGKRVEDKLWAEKGGLHRLVKGTDKVTHPANAKMTEVPETGAKHYLYRWE